MPLHVYDCPRCKHEEEILQTYERASYPHPCPKCKTIMVRKLGNLANFVWGRKRT